MRADYDSEGDTIQIDLADVERLDYGDEIDDADALRAAARAYELDADALIAAARAALAAPDRNIVLDVGIRAIG